MRDSHEDIHFLPPELSSWHHLAQFDDVDEELEAVTDGEHQDDDDEDGGDEMLPLCSCGRPGQKFSFLFQSFVDEEVEDDKSDERNQIDSDRNQSAYLESYLYLTQIFVYPMTQTYTCEYLLFILSSVGTTSFQDQVLSSPESFTAPIISRSPLMLCWTVCLIKY